MGAGGNVHATLRFADGSVGTHRLRDRRQLALPKETLDVTGEAATGGWTTSSGSPCGRPQGKSGHRVAHRPGQGPARPAGPLRARPSGPARPCRSRWSRWSPRPARPSPSGASLASGRPVTLVSRPDLGWYLRRLRRMSADRGALPRRWTSGRRRSGPRRQVRPGAAARPAARDPCRSGPSPRRCRVGHAPSVAAGRRCGRGRGRRPGAGRDVDGARCRRAPTAPTRTGSSTR